MLFRSGIQQSGLQRLVGYSLNVALPLLRGGCGLKSIEKLLHDPANCVVRRGRDYFAGEKEVGAKNELSIFATIGPAASLTFLTSTHSGSTTNLPHLTSRSAKLSQTRM